MRWARRNSYLIITHDLDFGAILTATNAQYPSVLQVRTQRKAEARRVKRRIAHRGHPPYAFADSLSRVSFFELFGLRKVRGRAAESHDAAADSMACRTLS
jgi:Domain of unknown function (DUF5615)